MAIQRLPIRPSLGHNLIQRVAHIGSDILHTTQVNILTPLRHQQPKKVQRSSRNLVGRETRRKAETYLIPILV
jgi:hypothetical protein